MNYCKAQWDAKLEDWFVVHKLNIKFSTWKDVKRKRRNLANKKLDLFKELTNKNKQYYLEQNSEKERINEWFNSKSTEDYKKDLESFNISQHDLAEDLGFNTSTVNRTILKTQINENVKALMYYYFQDENNRRNTYIETRGKKKKKKEILESKETNTIEELDTREQERDVIVHPEINEVELSSENESKEVLSLNDESVEDLKEQVNTWYNLAQKTLSILESKNEELERLKYLVDLARKK